MRRRCWSKACRPEFANQLTELITTVLDRHNAHLNDGVRRALGREPRDFADFAREAAASGVWGACDSIGSYENPGTRRGSHLLRHAWSHHG